MGMKRWSIAVLLFGALDVLLFTGPQHRFQEIINSLTGDVHNVQTQVNEVASTNRLGNGSANQVGKQSTTGKSGTANLAGTVSQSTVKKPTPVTVSTTTQTSEQDDDSKQTPTSSETSNRLSSTTGTTSTAQVVAGPSGVASGLHLGGNIDIHWYHHDGSSIQMDSLDYDGGNQFPLKGTDGNFSGDLVVLVGQFDSSKTKVVNWWTYSVPVHNGQIDATITLPYHGFLEVSVAPVKITTSGDFTTSSQFTFTNVNNTAASLSIAQMALLQSWLINYNENPTIHSLAESITANVRSQDAHASIQKLRVDEMRAVSNWVSAHIAYNWPAYKSNKTPWQQVSETVQIRVGVCNDESALAAAMLRSIGVPSQVIDGTASAPGVTGPHQWNESWDGAQWILFDPTWDQVYYNSQTNRVGLPAKIDDNYFDISPSVFDKTHLNGKVAAW